MKSMSYRITKMNVAQGIVQNLIAKLVSIPLPFSELIFKKESLGLIMQGSRKAFPAYRPIR